jgi:hypothetical protein
LECFFFKLPRNRHPAAPVTFWIFRAPVYQLAILQAPKQNRHPACPGVPWERSASQIYRKQQAYGAQSKDPGDAALADALASFPAANCKWR